MQQLRKLFGSQVVDSRYAVSNTLLVRLLVLAFHALKENLNQEPQAVACKLFRGTLPHVFLRLRLVVKVLGDLVYERLPHVGDGELVYPTPIL